LKWIVALALAAAARPAPAHDLWIEPTTFSPEPGQVVGAKLRVGVDLAGDPLPRHAALIDQFVFADAAGRQPLVGRERADPAGVLRARVPGLNVIGYHSRPSRVELPADKFDAYLREEGLDDIVALRSRGDAASTGTREQFFRCAKSLLLVGAPDEAQSDRALGFPLELVAERNPYLPGVGEDLPVRLTYEGRPLAGALVVAIRRTDAVERLAVRSDDDGRVRLRLRAGAMWLVKAVHMVPAPADSGADWSSYWASLTFESRSPETQQGR
jgi:uncharacterized GH25 family protein